MHEPEITYMESEATVTSPPKKDNGKVFNCNHCDYSTKRKSDLLRHMGKHDISKKKKCDKCNALFLTTYALTNHIKGHNGELSCKSCAKCFKSTQGLDEHEPRCGKSVTRKFVCNYCGMDFSREVHMQNHINSKHTKYTPFICSICGKSYPSKLSCRRHSQVCSGVEIIRCETCDKIFKTRSALKEHNISHHSTDVRRCSCGKTYRWRPSFVRHQKTTGHAKV
jgi:KRAB domain-containing zinc finger protein